MYCIGDILIKIDLRGRNTTEFDTRHHALLVIGLREDGHPIVAHMKFTDHTNKTGTLVTEPCPKAKDLYLIHCPAFSDKLRAEIASIANTAQQNNHLRIEQNFLQEEYNKSNEYRPETLLDATKAFRQLQAQPIQIANIESNEPLSVSCHNFVLSTIHLACHKMGEQVPLGLNISPQLGWSDLLYNSVIKDNSLTITPIRILFLPSLPVKSEPSYLPSRTDIRSSSSFHQPVKTLQIDNDPNQDNKKGDCFCIVM